MPSSEAPLVPELEHALSMATSAAGHACQFFPVVRTAPVMKLYYMHVRSGTRLTQ